ncbi:MAG: phytanoyl-CoA dioxygenase family protein [Bacteroidota bacterium]
MLKSLQGPQVQRYKDEGALFPIDVLRPEEIRHYRAQVQAMEDYFGRPMKHIELVHPHVHYPWAYELVRHPRVLDAVEDVLGPNILVHHSTLFCKYPQNDKYIAWHQDGFFMDFEEPQYVTAWVALTESNRQNGCLRVVLNTHRRKYEHAQVVDEKNMLASGLTMVENVEQTDIRDIELKAGQMSLHHVNLVHCSDANQSDDQRIGFAIRYIAPSVSQSTPHFGVMLVRGADHYQHYQHIEPKLCDTIAQGVREQRAFQKENLKRRGLVIAQAQT